ncbi:L-fucose kinase [Melanotaenia boesemani]|uniref:L-fucose kinase n=1 Tax=Melanotaenia boesemani TaxID=1250792 RepID=UPI001C048F24|nr:L-fucose kinase [Melanotaenia boesemani]XP_041853079.1 L-fucose kinase [Melanotaenia boesemani]
MSDNGRFQWTVVVLTCQHKDSVYSFQRELELRQQCGTLSQGALVLTVRDRQEPLGSGGATLNALLVAAEHLSSRAGHTVVTADVLDEAHILILHTGRDFPWSSCSRAFCWLPREKPEQKVQAPVCCLDLLLDCLSTQICPGSPPGVWVCSTDMILTVPPDFVLSWEGFSGVRVLALPGDISYASNHGVYLSDSQGRVQDIIYRGSREQILQAVMPDGKVPLVSGPVFFSRSVSEKLLQTHVTPPLDGCTYLGLDSGAPPLQISLFLDLLKCLCSDLTQDQFVSEERAGCSSTAGPQGAAVRSGRAELWRILRGSPLTLVYVPGGCYDYLTSTGKQHVDRLTCDWTDGNTLSHIQVEGSVSRGGQVINSVLEGNVAVATRAVVQHCYLQGPLDVPSGCLLSGLDSSTSPSIRQLALSSDIIIQGHRIELGELKLTVYTVVGAHDDLQVSSDGSSASFLHQSWSDFYSRTGIQPEELWVRGEQRSLLEARLFPVLHPRGGAVGLEGGIGWLLGGSGCLQRWREAWRLSLREVLSLTHQEAELQWREELLFLAGRRRVSDALQSRTNICLLPCIRAAVLGGQQGALLETLDSIAAGSLAQGAEPGVELGVAARCLSCIADVLVCMAGGKGGLRSGPAANEAWSAAYLLLEEGNLRGGVHALATQRRLWLSRPDLLVRAARHYEGAGQVLLRQAMMSSQRFIAIGQGEAPPTEEWQEVHCPARLDLAGGWSDTPPIAFEHGGSVTNVAVKVDGKRPIGARARRIREPRLLLVSYAGGRDSGVSTETICDTLEDLKDYCQPHAPGALLKAVCVCSGLVSLSSQHPLGDQLMQRWGGGVELHSWSELPTGSGLGTSSILAGALLAAVYRCTGQTYDTDSLIHAVLYLEQILTTGGGWQDQVGGLVGGVKVGRSGASLPLHVEVERLSLPAEFLTSLEQHLLLVYTGKTRLARNLLQDVVRSWYSRLPSMVLNAQQLVSNSEECARACSDGSLSRLGQCLDRSWQQKKLMAPGCEPASVRTMMEALSPLVLGQSLAGAGGGGFLYLLTREPQQQEVVLQVLNNTPGLGDFSVHSVELDMDGITVLPPSFT